MKKHALTTLGLALFFLVGCQAKHTLVPRVTLVASEVQSLSSTFEKVATAHIEAWNTHNKDTIIGLYTDDIVHFDGKPLYIGTEAVSKMVAETSASFPNLQGQLDDAYIGREDGLDVWEIWNFSGFTKDKPGHEYDLLQIRDGKIAYWTVFFDEVFMDSFGSHVDTDLQNNYIAAWSSGNPKKVGALYAPDAIREDSLFKEKIEGRKLIEGFATDFFAWYPKVTWKLIEPFEEDSPGNIDGGIFGIQVSDPSGKPCEVRVELLLEPSDKGIVKERIYYEVGTLITCGWAR